MNPITQAISAAHAIAARAVADRVRLDTLDIDDPAVELTGLDNALDELTGDELVVLAYAADVLARRSRAVQSHRRNSAVSAEIAAIKARKV